MSTTLELLDELAVELGHLERANCIDAALECGRHYRRAQELLEELGDRIALPPEEAHR